MPLRKDPPVTPTVIVRKKRLTASQATTSPSPSPSKKRVPTSPPQVPVPPVLAKTPPKPPSQPSAPLSQPDPTQPSRKQRMLQTRRELLALLCERWPQTFPTDLRQVKPFAIGLHLDIAKALPDVKPYLLRHAINFYQRGGRGAYWRAILNGGARYTLDGALKGEVTDKDKEHATQELAAIAAWWKTKRKSRQQWKDGVDSEQNRNPGEAPHTDKQESADL